MNYIDQNGINYNQIVRISYGLQDKNIEVYQNMPSGMGPNPMKLEGEKMKQFEQTLEAYNKVMIFDDIVAKKVLKDNAFKPKMS